LDSGFVDALLHPRVPAPVIDHHPRPACLCARASARYVTVASVPLTRRVALRFERNFRGGDRPAERGSKLTTFSGTAVLRAS